MITVRVSVSKKGVHNLKKLLAPLSDKVVSYYVDYIEKTIKNSIIHGESIFEYKPMSKIYKEKVFKSGAKLFAKLKNEVFIPHINPTSKKETYSVKSHKAKHYRLNTHWIHSYVKVEIGDYTPKISKDIKATIKYKHSEELEKNLKLINPIFDLNDNSVLNQIIKTCTVEFDNEYLNNKSQVFTSFQEALGLVQFKLENNETMVYKKVFSKFRGYHHYLKMYNNHIRGIQFKRYEYERRIYHNFISTPKTLYHYYGHGENYESLAEIDLASCFPLLLIIDLLNLRERPYYFVNNYLKKEFIRRFKNDKNSEEWKLCIAIANGKFYEYISQIIFSDKSKKSKSWLKKNISKILFGQFDKRPSWIKKKLMKRLPLFFKVLDFNKKNIYSNLKKGKMNELYQIYSNNGQKSEYKTACDYHVIRLMREESEIFNDRLLPKLWKQGFYAIPKHDAIICPLNQLEGVKQACIEFFTEEFGKGVFTLHEKVFYNHYKEHLNVA